MGECIKHTLWGYNHQRWGKWLLQSSESVWGKRVPCHVNVLIGGAITYPVSISWQFSTTSQAGTGTGLPQTTKNPRSLTLMETCTNLRFPKVMLMLRLWTWSPIIKTARMLAPVPVITLIIAFNFRSAKVHTGVKQQSAGNCSISCAVSHPWFKIRKLYTTWDLPCFLN